MKLLPIPRFASFDGNAAGFAIPAEGVNFLNAPDLAPHVYDVVAEAVHVAGGSVRRDGAALVRAVIVSDAPNPSPEWHRLSVAADGITLRAATHEGFLRAAATLRQVARQAPRAGRIPCCEIEDWPDIPLRGIMLDISRDKVPTMQSLFALADMMVELKLNELQLYTEHTFAYEKDGVVWRQASPMTAAEIRELDAYCRARFIDLAPNQNSFGHLTRWLDLPDYIHMAEAPDGFDFHWGTHSDAPFSLAPLDPKSLEFVERLYAELLPNFSSQLFNVGCDETHDIGQGKSKAAVAERGNGRVYLDYLLKIHKLAQQHGRRMAFWGDMIFREPELIPEIPKDVIGLVWGYNSDFPFDEQCEKYRATGLDFHVCPGVATWSSFCGRTSQMIANNKRAAAAACKHGATGFLNTDWGDNGHHQPTAISWLGYAAGAAVSWGCAQNDDLENTLSAAVDAHIFKLAQAPAGGDSSAQSARVAALASPAMLLWELGDIYRLTSKYDSTELFHAIIPRQKEPSSRVFAPEALLETVKKTAALKARIPLLKIPRADSSAIIDELALACDFMLWAAGLQLAKLGIAPPLPLPSTDEILAAHNRVWLLRNRPGGLGDSMKHIKEAQA